MSVFDYSSCIKIDFDKAILTDVGTIVPVGEYRYRDFVPYASSVNGTTYAANMAFDDSLSTRWLSAGSTTGQWLGFYSSTKMPVVKIRACFNDYKYLPNAYVLRGSNDNSTWTDILTGNFTNSVGWKELTLSGYSFRFWRLVFNSKYTTFGYMCHEMQVYCAELQGWQITGEEYEFEPSGKPVTKQYKIDKFTKSEDGKSLYVWLDLGARMWNPRSVTVNFSGSLLGPGGAQVEPFIETFTPVGITPIFNPNAPDHLTITSDFALTVKEVEYSSAKLDEPADQIAIFPPSLTLTVTKVGSLPL